MAWDRTQDLLFPGADTLPTELSGPVSLAITRLMGSIDLNRDMGGAHYSFCRDWSGCTLPSVICMGGEAPVFGCFQGIYEEKITLFMIYLCKLINTNIMCFIIPYPLNNMLCNKIPTFITQEQKFCSQMSSWQCNQCLGTQHNGVQV